MPQARVRLFYPNIALYVGPTPGLATGYHFAGGNTGANLVSQLHRVNSVGTSFDIQKTNIYQVGSLAALSREVLGVPDVGMTFSYNATDGTNESRMGFVVDGVTSCISGILNKTADEKNYFIKYAAQGVDAINDTDYSNHNTVGIGNGFITDYTFEAAVGQVATASVSVQALNVNYYAGSTGLFIPAVIPISGTKITDKLFSLPVATTGTAGMPTALRYGDITISAPNVLGATINGANSAHIQSCRVNIPLTRDPLARLGSRFPYSREINFQNLITTATITAFTSDLTTGTLVDLISTCQQGVGDLSITLRPCSAIGSTSNPTMIYTLKNASLDSYSESLAVGDLAQSVTMTFGSSIGNASDQTRGVFISGSTAG